MKDLRRGALRPHGEERLVPSARPGSTFTVFEGERFLGGSDDIRTAPRCVKAPGVSAGIVKPQCLRFPSNLRKFRIPSSRRKRPGAESSPAIDRRGAWRGGVSHDFFAFDEERGALLRPCGPEVRGPVRVCSGGHRGRPRGASGASTRCVCGVSRVHCKKRQTSGLRKCNEVAKLIT